MMADDDPNRRRTNHMHVRGRDILQKILQPDGSRNQPQYFQIHPPILNLPRPNVIIPPQEREHSQRHADYAPRSTGRDYTSSSRQRRILPRLDNQPQGGHHDSQDEENDEAGPRRDMSVATREQDGVERRRDIDKDQADVDLLRGKRKSEVHELLGTNLKSAGGHENGGPIEERNQSSQHMRWCYTAGCVVVCAVLVVASATLFLLFVANTRDPFDSPFAFQRNDNLDQLAAGYNSILEDLPRNYSTSARNKTLQLMEDISHTTRRADELSAFFGGPFCTTVRGALGSDFCVSSTNLQQSLGYATELAENYLFSMNETVSLSSALLVVVADHKSAIEQDLAAARMQALNRIIFGAKYPSDYAANERIREQKKVLLQQLSTVSHQLRQSDVSLQDERARVRSKNYRYVVAIQGYRDYVDAHPCASVDMSRVKNYLLEIPMCWLYNDDERQAFRKRFEEV